MKPLLILTATLFLLLTACGNDDKHDDPQTWVQPVGFPYPVYIGQFTGYTITDEKETILGGYGAEDDQEWVLHYYDSSSRGEGRPVEISSFTAVYQSSSQSVRLDWTVQSETDILCYQLWRNTQNDQAGALETGSPIAATNVCEEHSYQYVDSAVTLGQTYFYWLETVDNGGSSYHGPVHATAGSTPSGENLVRRAFPNPSDAWTVYVSVATNYQARAAIINAAGTIIREAGTCMPGVRRLSLHGWEMDAPSGLYRLMIWFEGEGKKYYTYGDLEYTAPPTPSQAAIDFIALHYGQDHQTFGSNALCNVYTDGDDDIYDAVFMDLPPVGSNAYYWELASRDRAIFGWDDWFDRYVDSFQGEISWAWDSSATDSGHHWVGNFPAQSEGYNFEAPHSDLRDQYRTLLGVDSR
jgi:hypothetical protein